MKKPTVYIMANQRNGAIYVGVTSNLIQRVWQHKNHLADGFTKKYKITTLVYFEPSINNGISNFSRKRIKEMVERKEDFSNRREKPILDGFVRFYSLNERPLDPLRG